MSAGQRLGRPSSRRHRELRSLGGIDRLDRGIQLAAQRHDQAHAEACLAPHVKALGQPATLVCYDKREAFLVLAWSEVNLDRDGLVSAPCMLQGIGE